MSIELTILGCGSATPTLLRNPSSQFLLINNHGYLIDCAEGTQKQLLQYGLKKSKIKAIFISHLHGDHYFGLVGLLTSMHLEKRTEPLLIFASKDLENIIALQLNASDTNLCYDIVFTPIDSNVHKKIYEDKNCSFYTLPLDHRIPTCGFVVREQPKKRKINVDKVKEYFIPNYFLKNIQEGDDYIKDNGDIIKNEELTLPPKKAMSYVYCSDTKYNESILEFIANVDLLYHEATFIEEHKQRANETFHSTAMQAATIASKAKVGKLLLGHFSAKYKNADVHLQEAKTIFENTFIAEDGLTLTIAL